MKISFIGEWYPMKLFFIGERHPHSLGPVPNEELKKARFYADSKICSIIYDNVTGFYMIKLSFQYGFQIEIFML